MREKVRGDGVAAGASGDVAEGEASPPRIYTVGAGGGLPSYADRALATALLESETDAPVGTATTDFKQSSAASETL